jgi:hypothetical protein
MHHRHVDVEVYIPYIQPWHQTSVFSFILHGPAHCSRYSLGRGNDVCFIRKADAMKPRILNEGRRRRRRRRRRRSCRV